MKPTETNALNLPGAIYDQVKSIDSCHASDVHCPGEFSHEGLPSTCLICHQRRKFIFSRGIHVRGSDALVQVLFILPCSTDIGNAMQVTCSISTVHYLIQNSQIPFSLLGYVLAT